MLLFGFAVGLVPELSAKLVFPVAVIADKAELGADKYQFTFTFENAGDQSIEITELKTSCGCTTAELSQKIYGPGESGQIRGVFYIGERQGVQKKTVTVFTNNLGQPEIRLGLEVEVPEVLTIKPGLLVWRVGGDSELKALQVLPSDSEVNVTSVECESGVFSVQLLPLGDGMGGCRVLVVPSRMDVSQRALIKIHASIRGAESKTYFAHALIK